MAQFFLYLAGLIIIIALYQTGTLDDVLLAIINTLSSCAAQPPQQ